jgi:predicted dehydrogenase
MDCARAGVRVVFAEKPIATRLSEADAMIATCRAHGAKLAVGCFARWHPFYRRARKIIDAGGIGRVLHVSVFSKSRISHNGSHTIDLARFMVGGEAVWAMGEMESDEAAATVDDLLGNGYVAFDNGARAYIHMMETGDSEWVGAMDVLGESGKLRFFASAREIEWWQVDPTSRRRELVRRLFPTPQVVESGNVRAVRDFVRCIETGKDPACTGEDARSALEIALAMRESHRQGGRRTHVPLADRDLGIQSWENVRWSLPRALEGRATATA